MADEDVTRAISPNELETALAVGNVVAGNYRILAHAGAGGMGIVYCSGFVPIRLIRTNDRCRDSEQFARN